MAKAKKLQFQRRIQEITRLILTGAELADIRHYAHQQGWDVGDRQLRRYIDAAYEEMEKIAGRDRKQLLGRHLLQRKGLFARAMKEGDLRLALQILRDEAQLESLYSSTKSGTPSASPSAEPPLTWQDEAVQLLRAAAPGDFGPPSPLAPTGRRLRLLGPAAPSPDQQLELLTLKHVNEQLEAAGMYLLLIRKGPPFDADHPLQRQDQFLLMYAYLYGTGHAGWKLFTSDQGLDGQELIARHYQGELLPMLDENLLPHAPDTPMMRQLLAEFDKPFTGTLVTAEGKADWWRAQLHEAPPDRVET